MWILRGISKVRNDVVNSVHKDVGVKLSISAPDTVERSALHQRYRHWECPGPILDLMVMRNILNAL
jgi:hypothetical protein